MKYLATLKVNWADEINLGFVAVVDEKFVDAIMDYQEDVLVEDMRIGTNQYVDILKKDFRFHSLTCEEAKMIDSVLTYTHTSLIKKVQELILRYEEECDD